VVVAWLIGLRVSQIKTGSLRQIRGAFGGATFFRKMVFYNMTNLGLTLLGIPAGILLIAGMVGSLFLLVH